MFAFTLELYLEALLAFESGVAAIKNVHEVDDIFKQLKATTQDAIDASFKTIMVGPDYSQWKFLLTRAGRGARIRRRSK